MSRKIINEIFWLRAISCLAVVLVHAVSLSHNVFDSSNNIKLNEQLDLVKLMFLFGTPMFIIISEVLLSHTYRDGLPTGFFKKRINFILIPFILMAFIYVPFLTNSYNPVILFKVLILNLFFGGYTGYFILIIFQFYILHALLHKKLDKWSPKIVLPVALFVNVAYLLPFNLINVPPDFKGASYLWSRGHWMLPFGWIFYFALGFYVGRDFNKVKNFIVKHKVLFMLLPIVSYLIIYVNYTTGFIELNSSKRIDNILFTTSIGALLILIGSKFNKVPRFIYFISSYSFQIYLIHRLVLYSLPRLPIENPFLYVVISAIIAIMLSILIAKILLKFKLSRYFIGQRLIVDTNKS